MFIAKEFNDLELERVINLPITTLSEWLKYFSNEAKEQQQIIGTTGYKTTNGASNVNNHAIIFK